MRETLAFSRLHTLVDELPSWMFIVAIALLHVLLRISTLPWMALDIDESVFWLGGKIWALGGLPYQDFIDNKPLGIFWLHRWLYLMFGEYSMVGIRIVQMLLGILTSLLLYQWGRQARSETTGRWLAFLYSCASVTLFPKLASSNIASLLNFPLTLSLYAWWRYQGTFRPFFFALSALAGGLCFQFKYQAGIHLVIIALHALTVYKRQPLRYARAACVYIFLWLIPSLVAWLWLFLHNLWNPYVTWTWIESQLYSQAHPDPGIMIFHAVMRSCVLILVCMPAGFGLFTRFFGSRDPSDSAVMLGWISLAAHWLAIAAGGRFYWHYFHQAIPSLIFVGVLSLEPFVRSKSAIWQNAWLKRALWLALIPALIWSGSRFFFDHTEEWIPDDFVLNQVKIGQWIDKNSQPDDMIFVWGFATTIYQASKRLPASRFIVGDRLTGRAPSNWNLPDAVEIGALSIIPEAWDLFWQDIQRHPPEIWVDTSTRPLKRYDKFPTRAYPALQQWLDSNYSFETHVEGCAIYRRKNP